MGGPHPSLSRRCSRSLAEHIRQSAVRHSAAPLNACPDYALIERLRGDRVVDVEEVEGRDTHGHTPCSRAQSGLGVGVASVRLAVCDAGPRRQSEYGGELSGSSRGAGTHRTNPPLRRGARQNRARGNPPQSRCFSETTVGAGSRDPTAFFS